MLWNIQMLNASRSDLGNAMKGLLTLWIFYSLQETSKTFRSYYRHISGTKLITQDCRSDRLDFCLGRNKLDEIFGEKLSTSKTQMTMISLTFSSTVSPLKNCKASIVLMLRATTELSSLTASSTTSLFGDFLRSKMAVLKSFFSCFILSKNERLIRLYVIFWHGLHKTKFTPAITHVFRSASPTTVNFHQY